MDSVRIVTLLTTSASMAFLWICYFWLYKNYTIDIFRQRMFVLRDELFDDAAQGLIKFDHPAYGTMRRAMNGFIRFAHKLDLLQAILLLFAVDDEKLATVDSLSFDKRLSEEMAGLDQETARKMHEYRSKMQKEVLFHCLRVSPFLALLISLPVLVAVIIKGIHRFNDSIISHLKGIESTAFSYGQLS